MFNQTLNECIKKAEECINISELLININSEQHVFQWNKRTKETIEFYNSMIQKFENLISQCPTDSSNSIDCKEITLMSNEIIVQCKNMINQCNVTPISRYPYASASKIRIFQSILPHSAKCIEVCEKFLSLYNN